MSSKLTTPFRARRGAVAVLAAFLTVFMLAVIAFAVDLGYLSLVRTQLQTTADAAALAGAGTMNTTLEDMKAAAENFAVRNKVAGRTAQLTSNEIEPGIWDTTARTFTPSSQLGNAVRVTVRTSETTGGETPLFFGRIFGKNSQAQQASAIATANPRDIAFVIDLSGSMNDDTDPSKTATLNSTYSAAGFPTIGTDLINQVYADFGYPCTYPTEPKQSIGQPLGVTTLSALTNSTSSPLKAAAIPTKYRILSTDSSSTRTKKAYSWTMDVQVPQIMPGVKPTPNSTTNYDYWYSYLSGSGVSSAIGYRTYVDFMMYNGRYRKPGSNLYVPLSRSSPDCPYHAEATAGGTFNFPPREQPTHASRRALIAAIKIIQDRNQNIGDPNQRDWVSLVIYDRINPAPQVLLPLTSDYVAAMQACTTLQACDDAAACTATETGLRYADNHLKPVSQGGAGRPSTDKIVVLLTDGVPNLYDSSAYANPTIGGYISAHPSGDFYASDNYRNTSLIQTSMMQGKHWQVYPVGIGLGTDYDFMDRMARMGMTADQNGQGPRGSGNPGEYEARLTEIFESIINNPRLRLVQ
ncbi:MAG: VWA domain-containing protein [Pirellulales bacterium]|nr:VWA domain-containing protein [Pirellulales bacterium]